MIVTITDLATDSDRLLERVVAGGETVQIERGGRIIAHMIPAVGASKQELLKVLRQIDWTEAERLELKRAMDAASEVLGYAGRD